MSLPYVSRRPPTKFGRRVLLNEPAPEVLMRAAAQAVRPAWKKHWQRAISRARDTVLTGEVEAAARAKDTQRMLDALLPAITELKKHLARGWPALFGEAMRHGATVAAHALPTPPATPPRSPLQQRLDTREAAARPPKTPTLTLDDASADAWINDYIADRLFNVGTDTEAAVRAVITSAIDETLDPREAATIAQQAIGLTSTQTGSLIKTAVAMGDAEGGATLDLAGRMIRIPPDGASPAFIENMLDAIGASYTADRVDVNASHDPAEASAEGQRELWDEAVDLGLIETSMQKMIVGGDPCDICQSIIDDGPIPLHSDYREEGPPFHVNCACVEVLIDE